MCDFYFGDSVFQPLKAFDANKLKGFKGYLKSKKWKYFSWYQNLRIALKSSYTHYIITGECFNISNWLVLLYCKFTRKKLYMWTHGLSRQREGFMRLIYGIFFRSADGLLMYNRYNCQYMLQLGCAQDKLHIIHNSLDTEYQSAIFNTLKPTNIYKDHFKNNHPTIIYIGRVQKVKKIPLLLQAIKHLKNRNIDVNLAIVGPTVNDFSTENTILELELQDRVWVYGACYEEATSAELIYNAYACVSPGNVGLTAIHSLSYGTPVITNNNFGIQMPEFEAVENGVTGSFFQDGNVADLAEKINQWTQIDEQERRHVRQLARKQIVEQWSVPYQIMVLQSILKDEGSAN